MLKLLRSLYNSKIEEDIKKLEEENIKKLEEGLMDIIITNTLNGNKLITPKYLLRPNTQLFIGQGNIICRKCPIFEVEKLEKLEKLEEGYYEYYHVINSNINKSLRTVCK